jgi:hypothetical protein
MVRAGYFSISNTTTYFVCNLEQVFAFDHISIRIDAQTKGVFGAPRLENWRTLFAKNEDGEV